MKPRYHFVVFALCLLLFGVALLPARVAYHWVADDLQPLALRQVSGTLWSGDVRQLSLDGVDLGAASWHFTPEVLLEGRWGVVLNVSGGASAGEIRLGMDTDRRVYLDVERLRMHLGTWVKGLNGVAHDPQGILAFRDTQAVWRRKSLENVTGNVRWEGAALGDPDYLDLGSVTARISYKDAALRLSAEDGGPHRIQGGLRWTDAGELVFDGLINTAEVPKTWSARLPVIDAENNAEIRFKRLWWSAQGSQDS